MFSKDTRRQAWAALLGLAAMAWIGAAQAADVSPDLLRRIEAMEQELKALKRELAAAKAQAKKAQQTAAKATREAAVAKREARAEENELATWHLAGYSSVNFESSDRQGETEQFADLKFNPVFHFQYDDLVLFEGELEFEAQSDGGTKVALEYASLDYLVSDWLTLVAGKFLSPLGQFQERLHPTWINKLPDRPAGFNEANGILPISELGLLARGGITLSPTILNYALYVGNGPQVELTAGELEKLALEGFGTDDNNPLALGARVGILPIANLEIGGSVLTSEVRGKKGAVSGEVSEGRYVLWGADLAYTEGPWDVRFEYVSSELGSFFSQAEAGSPTELIPETDWEMWYAQVAYRLSGITNDPLLGRLEPVVRYGEVDAKGFSNFVNAAGPESRLTLGLNYVLRPSIIAKIAVSWRDLHLAGSENGTDIKAQLAYGF